MKELTKFLLSYLSKVNATKFQVDDLNNPQSKDSVFQSRHSNQPRIPVLCSLKVSLTVKVDSSNRNETAKSMRLCKKYLSTMNKGLNVALLTIIMKYTFPIR